MSGTEHQCKISSPTIKPDLKTSRKGGQRNKEEFLIGRAINLKLSKASENNSIFICLGVRGHVNKTFVLIQINIKVRESLGEIKWLTTHHLPVQWGTQTGPPNCQSCVLYSSDTLPLMNRIINERRRHMIRSYSFLLFRMNGNKGKHFQNRQLETSFMQTALELAKATFQGKKA